MSDLPSQPGEPLSAQLPLPLSDENTVTDPSRGNAISVTDQLKWARMIARGVRQAFHFKIGSQEELDLEATAYLAIVELVGRFDAAKIPLGGDLNCAFRGWAAIGVRCRCQREARRLRNGGTYHTRREKARKAIVIERLKNGPDLIDPLSLVEDEENENKTE
jgi:hypothetical protein